MSRKRIEINKIRGKRLGELLSENGMGQKELAEKIGYSPEHISYIINGRRNLTQDAAESIVKIFPGVRVGWLLGYDNSKTDLDAVEHVVKAKTDNLKAAQILFEFAAKNLGYEIQWQDRISGGSEDILYFSNPLSYEEFEREICFYLIKGSERIAITNKENKLMLEEILRYPIYLLDGLISRKNDAWHPFSLEKEDLHNG